MTTLEKIMAEIEQIVDEEQKHDKKWAMGLRYAVKIIDKYAEQEPKTGHWILADEQNKEDVENDNYLFICSECQCSDIHAKGTKVPYCWKCGAKMDKEQTDEVDN